MEKGLAPEVMWLTQKENKAKGCACIQTSFSCIEPAYRRFWRVAVLPDLAQPKEIRIASGDSYEVGPNRRGLALPQLPPVFWNHTMDCTVSMVSPEASLSTEPNDAKISIFPSPSTSEG